MKHRIHNTFAAFEILEPRRLFAVVSLNAAQVIRAIDTKLLGINSAPWDGQMSTSATATMVNAIGTTAVRMGGGSYIDANWHFNLNNQSQTLGQQANFTAAHGNSGFVTVNYGTASPQEAAAELAYLNGSPSDTTNIGLGEQWNTGTSSWTDVNWQTAGYWASLRAAAPISPNDGLNFLRLNRPAPFAFHYWGIGNEIYGSWEMDQHGVGGDHLPMPGGAVRAPHDPTTIVSFARQFQDLANLIDPSISIGIDSQATDSQFSNWIANVLTQANSAHQNFHMGFLSDHLYTQNPGNESDAFLLAAPSTIISPTPANPLNWVQRAQKYRTLINTNYGSAAGAVMELLATEFNSVSSNPGKQMTSLVNGVYIADSLGSLMQTEYNGAYIWDLHNSWTNGNASTSLYGWRTGGDYGVISVGGGPGLPQSGLNVPYPNYFAEQLASKIILPGGTVVQASSTDSNLNVYAVRETDGHLKLLVINRSKAGLNNNTTGTPALINGTFNLSGFIPAPQAQLWQFGSVEDNIAKNSTNGLTALANSNPILTLSGSSFDFAFPSLSISVLDLIPAAPQVVSAMYPFDLAPNRVQFTFNQDVSASLSPSDLLLMNLGGGAVPAVQSVQWDGPTSTATFILDPGAPQDGNYRATLPAASITNANGTPMAQDAAFDFFVLAGDANRDRTVNLLDFNILASNFGQSNRVFSQGDFNYDTVVNLLDFNILAQRFGTSVAPGTFSVGKIAGPTSNQTHVIDTLRDDVLA